MPKYLILIIIIIACGGLFFVFSKTRNFEVLNTPGQTLNNQNVSLPSIPEATSSDTKIEIKNNSSDIENQKPLSNPPKVVKAIYITSWVSGIDSRMNELIKLINNTELNAVVIDIKDYSGYITYDIKNDDVEKYHAKEIRTPKINSLIKKLHDNNIYVIARITVFQDPVLAKARSDLAVKSRSTGAIWKDSKGLSWMDPASKEVWDYNISIAKDAISRGFDEINFDYVRFPSDGNLSDLFFPVWQKTQTNTEEKSDVIKKFFAYLREQLKGNKISADLFGLATVNNGDLGIGQVIENAYQYFDFVCPMVYPSHYASGFLGYKNPASYPYEVIKYSMEIALERLKNCNLFDGQHSTTTASITSTTSSSTISTFPKCSVKPLAKLRPWLQDFDLGATYTKEMVKKEIQAVYDAGISDGWMLWDPKNIYESM